MKKVFTFSVLTAVAIVMAGCAGNTQSKMSHDDMMALQNTVQEARDNAIQANQNAQAAYELARQNAERINRVFRKSQLK